MTENWPVVELSREVVEASVDVIYLLDGELRIVYCNPAWDAFALANDGERVTRAKVCGASLFDFIAPVMRGFYREVFAACADDCEPFSFDYECSSPGSHRRFRMQVLPSKAGRGFGVINALRVEQPHSRTASPPSEEYVGAGGIITMCAHCRRTRSAKQTVRWDWVPAYVANTTALISHGLCPTCHSYHYDSLLKGLREKTAR